MNDTVKCQVIAPPRSDGRCVVARDIASADLATRIHQFGAVKIEGLLSSDLVAEIMSEAARIYAERDALQAAGQLPSSLYDQHVRKRLMLLKQVPLRGSTAAEVLSAGLLRDTAKAVLQRQEVSPPNDCFVRTIYAGKDAWQLPFHQDQTLLSMPLFNVWIALTPCGLDAPGLELVMTDKTEILQTFADDRKHFAAAQKQISEDVILARYGADSLWRPEMQAGDALVFRGTTVHRTHVAPGMSKSRTSIELRLA